MVLPEALARVMGHGEHALSPNDVMSGNRGRMKSHHAVQAHVWRPSGGLVGVGNSFRHGVTHDYKLERIAHWVEGALARRCGAREMFNVQRSVVVCCLRYFHSLISRNESTFGDKQPLNVEH